MKNKKTEARSRRKKSIRKKIYGTKETPRLCVFRSNLHIYAQVIDDDNGITLIDASSNRKDAKEAIEKSEKKPAGKSEVAFHVGQILGKKIIDADLKGIVFDRNGYLYHGRVKSLADGIRKAGVKF